eukprot:TRINITY_DN5100_c0_g4_i3.p1 TRINITY_DN5100_c0_g4~~TRINITY_DN5100_c0_g4_i3.p1  ORF type:complete len:922 (+),score=215.60 TRINITY_DN5100_c0_g4_i3:138-2903(+)
MPKTYLRYSAGPAIGLVFSSGISFDKNNELAICGSLESINIWNIRRGELVSVLKDGNESKSEITEISVSSDGINVAAGYKDGSIKIFDMKEKNCKMTFNGHRNAISCLRFNSSGSLLISGSRDTDIVVWDIVGECGLYRLKGHRDMVTEVFLLEKSNRLISSSKDSLVKLWDLDTQHCIATIVGHRNEVWAFDVSPDERRLVTGTSDDSLRFWSLDESEFPKIPFGQNATGTYADEEKDANQTQNDGEKVYAKFIGVVKRQSKERVERIRFHKGGKIFAVQTNDTKLEVFNVHEASQIKFKAKRQKQRKNKKNQKKTKESDEMEEEAEEHSDEKKESKVKASLEFSFQQTITSSFKIKSFSFSSLNHGIIMGLANNKVEVFSLKKQNGSEEKNESHTHELISSLELGGHRSDVRDVALSGDDSMLLTTSSNGIKVWNVDSQKCVRTIKSGYGLCGVFVPGNKHVIIGTKAGQLEVYDLTSSTCIQIIDAHKAAIWSMDVKGDKSGIVTGSEDKDIKFWEFELVVDSDSGTKRLALVLTRTLKMSDEVMNVRFSLDQKFVAVSLLDNTVKIFYEDNLKFFLSLYGHKLPVMSMDFSSDSTLIVTASADKNIKIWGTDFGDCHKSIFAHDDSITGVRFVQKTHYFFSCSKDKTIKYWDADTFDHIQTLNTHHAAVLSLAIPKNGNFIVSGSSDRSIRIFFRTDQQLFLEEEREKEMEALFETEELRERREEEEGVESGPATKKTMETIKSGERLIEAILLANQETKKMEEYKEELQDAESEEKEAKKRKLSGDDDDMMDFEGGEKVSDDEELKKPLVAAPMVDPFLMGLSPSDYLLKQLKMVKMSELEESLRVLPFAVALEFLKYLEKWVAQGASIELVCRCLFYIIQLYHNQIRTHPSAINVIDSLKFNVHRRLQSKGHYWN